MSKNQDEKSDNFSAIGEHTSSGKAEIAEEAAAEAADKVNNVVRFLSSALIMCVYVAGSVILLPTTVHERIMQRESITTTVIRIYLDSMHLPPLLDN